jgi:AcrR family transcriptional regulator
MNDTKQKILDTAERLFAENGYSATSLRHIITEAGVNLAAIHYHFGSKQDLLDQLILRKAGPMNERRLKLLDQFEANAAPAPPSVEKIMEALIAPAILMEKSPEFVKLMGRIILEGLMPEIAMRHFQPLIVRFISALKRALPGTDERELRWKMRFVTGAMAHTLTARPETFPERAQESPALISRMLVAFVSSGLRGTAVVDNGIEVSQ